MPRSIWKGSISFGLVQIPVSVFSAVSQNQLSFNLLDPSDNAPVGYKRYNKKTGEEVEWGEVVKGYELDSGEFVILTDEDFEKANVKATSTIDIQDFVDAKAISPEYFDKPYYLAPTQKNNKAYALLRETLKRSDKIGVAKIVMRSRQHLAAVMTHDDVILLELLRFPNELRGTDDLELPSEELDDLGVTDKELKMADRLVDDMAAEWDPENYNDEYREDLLRVIHEKAETGKVKAAEVPEEEEEEVVDVMELLKRSLEGNGHKKKAKAS